MRSDMWFVDVFISVADLIVEGFDFHSLDGFEDGLADDGWDFLPAAVEVFDIEIDAELFLDYYRELALGSF